MLEGHALEREKVAIAMMQEIAKDKRTEMMKQEREKRLEKEEEPATIKQIGFLKILGVSFDGKITKKEARELIDKAKANNSRQR
jgi:hypothetical protein